MSASSPFSRRQWLGRIALPAVTGTLAAAAANAATTPVAAAQPGPLPGTDPARWNVRDFGASGDGTTLDTAAVQAALDAAHAAGGGTVIVPAGTFLVGTLDLKSHVTLHLAAQGRLLGSPDPAHYAAGRGIPPGNGNIVLLSASDAENIAIEGPGTIDGNGAAFFTGQGDMTGPGQNSAQGYFQRPHLLVFHRCQRIRLRDVFLTASAYHGVRILRCTHVQFHGVRIHNRVNKNNDGFHFNDCRHVHVSACDVACQDDACALFGSNAFVTVSDSTFSTRWSVFRFGGGSPRNITITNCVISDTFGCPIKMRFGAGNCAENILFSNLVFDRVTGPISIGFDPRRRARDPAETPDAAAPAYVRHLAFHGLRGTVLADGQQYEDMPWPQAYRPGEQHTCIVLNGVHDGVLEDISFTDVHLTFAGGGTPAEAERAMPDLAGEYFEIGPPPAHGLYARNVRGLTLTSVRFATATPDARPALVFDQVDDVAIQALTLQGQPTAAVLMRLHDTQRLLLTALRVLGPTPALLQVEGIRSAAITIAGGDWSTARQRELRAADTPADAVSWRP